MPDHLRFFGPGFALKIERADHVGDGRGIDSVGIEQFGLLFFEHVLDRAAKRFTSDDFSDHGNSF